MRPMHLESQVVIRRTPEEVGAFLGDPANISKWDRGVAAVRQTAAPPAGGVGLEFETIAHPAAPDTAQAQGRMSYRVAEVGSNHSTVQLTSSEGNARFFRSARWTFRVDPAGEGTRLTCCADFELRLRYIFLAPVFYAPRSAILRDLRDLKRVLESG